MFNSKKTLLAAMFSVLLSYGTAFAHSGGTDANGCHTDHKTGSYHCHGGGGGTSGGGSYNYTSPAKPTCGFDSYKSAYGTCTRYEDTADGASSTTLQRGPCPLGQFSVGEECLSAVQACIKRHGSDTQHTEDGTCHCKDGYRLESGVCKYINTAKNKRDDVVSKINRKIQRNTKQSGSSSVTTPQGETAKVLSTVDGDTIKIKLGTKNDTVRVIGIDTPETVDPRKPVQCYGKEASAKMKALVSGKTIILEKNPAEERDKYQRLLRYVWLDGVDIGAKLIQDGYAFSYKQYPHPKLDAYNKLEQEARDAGRGLWGNVCSNAGTTSSKSSKRSTTSTTCEIKGNINSKKEHIYHVPGCASYNATVIDESAGEKMFCSEQEAKAAGWRKALNCP